jgi:hypothetical protein
MGIRRTVMLAMAMPFAKKAKQIFDDRGGAAGLRTDADRLRAAASQPGSPVDKARAAVSALKRPAHEG